MFIKFNRNNIMNEAFFKKSSKAFTLSEVLIAIGIMGVLVAILVPVIFQAKPHYNKMLFKKAMFTMQLAVNSIIKDSTAYPSTASGTDLSSGLSVEKGFNNTTVSINGTKNKFCYFLTQQLNTVGAVYCPAANSVDAGWNDTAMANFRTSDGILWKIHFQSGDGNADTQFPLSPFPASGLAGTPVNFVIDVNGANAPNCTASTAASFANVAQCPVTADCSSDPDIYIADVRYDGRIHIGGYGNSAPYVDKCAESVMSDFGQSK